VEDEHQRLALNRSGCRQVHRWSGGHDDVVATGLSDLHAVRCFQTGFTGKRVPCFGTGVTMFRRRHARIKNGFHVLRRIVLAGVDHKRAYFGDVFAAGRRAPISVLDRKQPYLVERFDDRCVCTLGLLGRGECRISVQVPERLGLREWPERLVSDDPAAHGVTASLLDGSANLRICAFRKRQQADAGDRKDIGTHAHLQCLR